MAGYRVFKQGKYRMDVLGQPLDEAAKVSWITKLPYLQLSSTPPNALVMPAGQYTFMDYIKVGLSSQIIMGMLVVFVLPLLLPF